MTKKYKLVGPKNDQSNQDGGFKIRMPMFSNKIGFATPALPLIPNSVAPGFVSPMIGMTKPINLFPETNPLIRWYNEAKKMNAESSPATEEDSKWKKTKKDGKNAIVDYSSGTRKYYTGAGALIVFKEGDNYNVVLFKNRNTNEYEEAGGGIEDVDYAESSTLERTAKREVAEESRNTINIGLDLRNQQAVDVDNYKCYVIYVGNVSTANVVTAYDTNKEIIDRSSLEGSWKETNDVKVFSLAQLAICSSPCTSIDGSSHKISERTLKVIKKFLSVDATKGTMTIPSLPIHTMILKPKATLPAPVLRQTTTYTIV